MHKTLLMITAISAGCAFGQTVPAMPKVGVQMADVGPMTMGQIRIGPAETVTGAPYSAQVVTERLQVLTDGNRIQQTTSGSVARDSQGRVRRDEALPGLGSNAGDAPHIVMIDDPVAQVHWTLDAQRKIAIKMPFPAVKGGGFAAFAMAPPPVAANKTWAFASSGVTGTQTSGAVVTAQTVRSDSPSNDSMVSDTDLGPETMEGVLVQGKRITRTIPAGQIGNEQPLVITTETWYSPDLKVLVMSKSDDPRMGETTYKLTEIQRSEPAASLFQPPEDYTVKDAKDQHVSLSLPNVVYQEIKKD